MEWLLGWFARLRAGLGLDGTHRGESQSCALRCPKMHLVTWNKLRTPVAEPATPATTPALATLGETVLTEEGLRT